MTRKLQTSYIIDQRGGRSSYRAHGEIGRSVPLHSFRALVRIWGDIPQLPPQLTNVVYSCAHIVGEGFRYLLANNAGQFRSVSIGTDHDLQWPIAMDATKVKITFRRYISYVCRDTLLLAELPDLCRGFWVINGTEYHICAVQIGSLKVPIDVINLSLCYPECHFIIEAGGRTDNGYFGIGIEGVEDATCSHLRRNPR